MSTWLIGSGQSDHPSDQIRAKVVCCKTLTTLWPDQWLLNHQDPILAPYGSPSTANRWAPWWGCLTSLQRYSRQIQQPQLTGRSGPEWTWEQWQWRGTLHYWNLTVRLFSVISRKLIGEGFLLLCRDAVSVFYSPSQLGKRGVKSLKASERS